MDIEISIIGVDDSDNQIDEVFGNIDSALDYLEELKEKLEEDACDENK